jgi:hypothetical protein
MTLAKPDQRSLNQVLQNWFLFFCSIILLILGSVSYLGAQLDDEYIVFAYAHRIVEYGEIAWNTGARVEGYSSALHLFLMVLGCWAKFDLTLFSRFVSFTAASCTLLFVLHRRFGPHRGLLTLMISAWQPFQRWSVSGLDTAIAVLVGAAAWSLMFAGRRSWSIGILLLAIFSLTRPEGSAWLLAGLILRVRYPRALGLPEGLSCISILSLLTYHWFRFHYFNEFFPTPWLVKIVAVDDFHRGVREACYEALSAAPILAACFLFRRQIPIGVWLPMLIQAALVVRANGDWMGHGRLMLPAVVASAAAAFASGSPRSFSASSLALISPLAFVSFMWESAPMQGAAARWRTPASVFHPEKAINIVWKVPLLDEVEFMIRRVPPGSGVQITDVGLPGNLDDIRVWDGAGLTDRVVAELLSSDDHSLNEVIKQRLEDPNKIWCLRYGVSPDGSDPADPWLISLFPETATKPDQNGLFWRCRAGGDVSFEVASARWRSLLARFPHADEIRLRFAQFQLDDGRADAALSTVQEVDWPGNQADGWLILRAPDNIPYTINRGWPMYRNGQMSSAVMPSDFWRQHFISFDVDSPGRDGAQVTIRWSPACGDAAKLMVKEATTLPLPPCDSVGPRSVTIDFENDVTENDFDRNIYVTLGLGKPIPAR